LRDFQADDVDAERVQHCIPEEGLSLRDSSGGIFDLQAMRLIDSI
jgi:hypothetical protein